MIHMHPQTWLIGRQDPQEQRNRMHLVALNEAKLATEHRLSQAETAAPAGPVRRIALATATGSNTDLAACCA
jgi:hypothetical protein